MYNPSKHTRTSLKVNESTEGETIEEKLVRVTTNKEPIKDGAPIIYTERAEGVQAGYNIKTDRWEIAIDAMDAIAKSETAKRQAKMEVVKDGGAESIQGDASNTESK